MASKRRPVTRSTLAPSPEVPEQSGSEEVRELRAQMTTLIGMIQRQRSQIERLQELLEQQVATAAVTTTKGHGPPAPSARAPNVPEGVSILVAPAAAHPLPASVSLAASGPMILDTAAGEVRQEHEAFKESGVKKRPRGGSGEQSSSKKAPKYQKRRSIRQGPKRCVICGGEHRVGKCRNRAGRCFKYGRAGHMARQCTEGVPPAPSVASASEIQRQSGGVPSAIAVSAGLGHVGGVVELEDNALCGLRFEMRRSRPSLNRAKIKI
uniref:CCHC-type domain-containing protein n=1 Tax=Ananas comosus var. bracteatus TaxID=296719 RepID=A0A6V7QBW6_ANACO|nr:unnamed protein product [Ananas comosus var. bracteatus]